MVPKFMAWDKKYKMIMTVNEIDFEKNTVWLEADNGDHENRHTLTRDFNDVVLMQYTGLYDVNGNQYCQDDLVKWNGSIYRLIRGTYAFELYGFYRQRQDEPYDYFSEGAYLEGEIIGNVWEDGDLINDSEGAEEN